MNKQIRSFFKCFPSKSHKVIVRKVHLKVIFFFGNMSMYIYHVYKGAHRGHKKMSDILEMVLQVVVS